MHHPNGQGNGGRRARPPGQNRSKAIKDGEMGEDEGDRLLKDLDKVTKTVTDEIDALLESKQKEIMEV